MKLNVDGCKVFGEIGQQHILVSAELIWSWLVLSFECHCSTSSSSLVPHSCPSAPLQPCDHLCGFLPFAVAGRSRPCTSALPAMVMPSLQPPTALLVPPTLSFSQFPATPLGSWVLSEKLFFTEPHRCQPMAACEHNATWWCATNVGHPQLHTSWRESTFREHECFYF